MGSQWDSNRFLVDKNPSRIEMGDFFWQAMPGFRCLRQERMGQLDGRLSGEERKTLEIELEDLLGWPSLGKGLDHS